MQPERGQAKGGDYLCMHFRRKDYLRHTVLRIPSIKGAAEQMTKKLDALGLKTIFVSTDGTPEEYEEFKREMGEGYTVTKFQPSGDQLEKYMDGGVAIIDQIICSHARLEPFSHLLECF